MDEARGLGEQAGRLRDAAERLIRAHLDLARAEFSEIADQVKRLVGLAALALAAVLFALLLVLIGLPLFVGEWLFGSLGWGILHGFLFALGLAVTAGVVALGAGARGVWLPALLGALTALGFGLLLGLDLAHDGAAALAARASTDAGLTLPAGWENTIAGAAGGAIIGAVLLLVLAAASRPSWRGALSALVFGALLGALLGAIFGSVRVGAQVGAALGLTAGQLAWIIATALGASAIDVSKTFEHLTPTTTIETAKETWEWVRRRIRRASR